MIENWRGTKVRKSAICKRDLATKITRPFKLTTTRRRPMIFARERRFFKIGIRIRARPTTTTSFRTCLVIRAFKSWVMMGKRKNSNSKGRFRWKTWTKQANDKNTRRVCRRSVNLKDQPRCAANLLTTILSTSWLKPRKGSQSRVAAV